MVDKPGRIPAGELSAYERWELPNLEGGSAFNHMHSASSSTRSIKPLTAEDLENIRQQAYQAGFEEGKADGLVAGREQGFEAGQPEGLQQGIADGQKQVEQTIKHLKQLMVSLLDPISEQQQIVQQATLNIALAVARTVIYRELKLDSSSIKLALADIFQSLPKPGREMAIKINPGDMAHVQAVIQELNEKVELASDPVISVGGCLIKTSSQLIDYTIEKRFQKTVHAMLRNVSRSDSGNNSLESSSTIEELSEYPTDILTEAEAEAEAEAGTETEAGNLESGNAPAGNDQSDGEPSSGDQDDSA